MDDRWGHADRSMLLRGYRVFVEGFGGMKQQWPFRKTIIALILIDAVLVYTTIAFYAANWEHIFR